MFRYLVIALVLMQFACDKIDDGKNDPEPPAETDEDPIETTPDPEAEVWTPTAGQTINVLVTYTQDAWDDALANGQDHWALAAARVELTNLVLSNSGVSHRAALAGVVPLTHGGAPISENDIAGEAPCASEAFGPKCAATWLQLEIAARNDLFAERSSTEADVVMLMMLTTEDGSGGAANAFGLPLYEEAAESACATVLYQQDLTFTHELGHLLLAGHDRYRVAEEALGTGATVEEIRNHADTLSGEGHGFTAHDLEAYTVMAYPNDCEAELPVGTTCTQVPWFSNPEVSYLGTDLGTQETERNVCNVEHFGSLVASYHEIRSGTAPPGPTLADLQEPWCDDYVLAHTFDVGGELCDVGDLSVTTDADLLSALDGCGTIRGNLTISTGVASLDALAQLVTVEGNLAIYSTTLTQGLEGLEQLARVDGTLTIASDDLFDASPVASFEPLQSLRTIGRLLVNRASILDLTGLEGVSVLDTIDILSCSSLVSLRGLDNVAVVTDRVLVSDCDALTTLDGLGSLAHTSSLQIDSNDALTSLLALHPSLRTVYDLEVVDNPNLEECELPYLVAESTLDSGNGPGCVF